MTDNQVSKVVVTGLGATTPIGGTALLIGFGAGLVYAAQVVTLP